MPNLLVNTDRIVATASELNTINGQIRDGFESVEKAMNHLKKTWEGPAANYAMKKFTSTLAGGLEARYTAMNNYSTFLLSSVGEGYVQTETVNTSLADLFK